MATLRVTRTGNRHAFDVIEGKPSFQERHSATGIQVMYRGIIGNGRIRTYANVVGHCTIRHKHEISENIIDRFHLHEGETVHARLSRLDDGSHIYIIES